MTQTVWLVRHPPVTLAWQKRCYGQSDPGLSRDGAKMAKKIAAEIAAFSPDLVIHSGLQRTRCIADLLARTGVPIRSEPLWRERHFGSWEGRSWHGIYRETGNAMDGMLTHPDSFRPGGGETTVDLMERVQKARENLPLVSRIAVIAHGGSIACARALHDGGDITDIVDLILSAGEKVVLKQ